MESIASLNLVNDFQGNCEQRENNSKGSKGSHCLPPVRFPRLHVPYIEFRKTPAKLALGRAGADGDSVYNPGRSFLTW